MCLLMKIHTATHEAVTPGKIKKQQLNLMKGLDLNMNLQEQRGQKKTC